jgi:hypothetical protein
VGCELYIYCCCLCCLWPLCVHLLPTAHIPFLWHKGRDFIKHEAKGKDVKVGLMRGNSARLHAAHLQLQHKSVRGWHADVMPNTRVCWPQLLFGWCLRKLHAFAGTNRFMISAASTHQAVSAQTAVLCCAMCCAVLRRAVWCYYKSMRVGLCPAGAAAVQDGDSAG